MSGMPTDQTVHPATREKSSEKADMTDTRTVQAPPRIEALLTAAHRDRTLLEQRCGALERAGIAAEHLPEPVARMAFALLGDHERETLVADLRTHWGALQAKGLVAGAIQEAATAELRLLVHVREHTEAIGSVWERLQAAGDAPEPPRGIWHCARRVRGLWGEPARVHFRMDGVRHLLIEPDPIFGLQPALMAADPDLRHSGSFQFPVDHGAIRITMLHRSGALYRHTVESMIEEMP
jgi:hypothetical protein